MHHPSVSNFILSRIAVVTPAVKKSAINCLCLIVLAGFASQKTSAVASDLLPLINPTQWGNTIALTTLGGTLYTIEKNGALYRTDLKAGKWDQLGKADFLNTRFLFADAQSLYTIEADGSLYRINPASGAWNRVGQADVWKDTITLVTLNDILYTIERGGGLYRTNLSTGQSMQLGKSEFANTKLIFADGQNLYTIETSGALYRVNPGNGAWSKIGSEDAWKETIVGTTMGGRIYSVERSGGLYETNPATGIWKQIGKAEFGNAQFLFGAYGSLYTLEAGSLFRINPANGSWVQLGPKTLWGNWTLQEPASEDVGAH